MSTKWTRRGIAAMHIGLALPASAGSLTYTYNDAGRLTQASGTPGTRAYQLDPAGNRTDLSLQVGLDSAVLPSMTASADRVPSNGAPSAGLASANLTATRINEP